MFFKHKKESVLSSLYLGNIRYRRFERKRDSVSSFLNARDIWHRYFFE